MSKSPAEKGKELFEKEEEAERATAKIFNPKKLAQESSCEKTVFDKDLGEIKYHTLRMDELDDLDTSASDQERGRLLLFRLLRKAYPDLTLEDVRAFTAWKAGRILHLISEAEGFFSPAQAFTTGSSATQRPK